MSKSSSFDLNNPFWQCACKRYQHTELRNCLLRLQDEYDCCVNALLLMCWLGEQGISIDKAFISKLNLCLEPLGDAINSLRNSRRALKPQSHLLDYYHKLTDIELDLEQQQIAQIYQLCCTYKIFQLSVVGENYVAHNIATYTGDLASSKRAEPLNLLQLLAQLWNAHNERTLKP